MSKKKYRVGRIALAATLMTAAAGAVSAGAGMTRAGAATSAAAISLDPTFGTGGTVTTDITALGLPGYADAAVLQSNGDIVVGGPFGLARYLPTGKLDTSFGTAGVDAAANNSGIFDAMALQPDGKIILASNQADPAANGFTAQELRVSRYNANGTPDTTFGTDGTVGTVGTEIFTPPGGGTSAQADAVLVQSDGKILVGGQADTPSAPRTFTDDGFVVRYNPNGSLDTSFGSGGKTLITASPEVSGLALDATGDIFALPSATTFPAPDPETELSPSGAVNATVTPAPLVTQSANAVAPAFVPTGGFIVGTSVALNRRDTLSDALVSTYSPAGALVSTTGNFVFSGTAGSVRDSAGDVVYLPNGQALVEGTAGNGVAFAELGPDDTFNTAFGTGGIALAPAAVDNGLPVLQPDGKLLLVTTTTNTSNDHTLITIQRISV